MVGNLVVDNLKGDSLKVDNLVELLEDLEEGIQEDSLVVPFLEDRLVVDIPLEEVHRH